MKFSLSLSLSLSLGLFLLVVVDSARGEFQAGAARRIITPNPLLPVSGGLGPTAPAREKQGELTARAIVFQNDNTTVAVVSLDLLGFPAVLCDRVRARVPRIPARNILIGSTHTHSAPDCYAFPDGRGGHTGDLAYMEFVCVKTAEAVNEALDKLQPARLKIATGEAQGKIAYNYYAPDLYDRRMSVIQAVRSSGETIATLVNYAVHPEVLGSKVGIVSPDLVGPLCDRLEEKAGGMALFMNGAQGGMITADNRDFEQLKDPLRAYWNDLRTWNECLRIGHTMADEAARIVKDASTQAAPSLFCGAIDVAIPVDNETLWSVILGSPLKYPRNPDRTITTRVNVVNLGNAQILTVPGEALPNIGFYLKRKMRGEHNLLFGLTNDAFGYILTKVDYQSFPRYEYISRTSLGEMTGEILMDRSLAFVDQSPEPDRTKRSQTATTAKVADNTLTDQEKQAGWVLLFDGATTKGWMSPKEKPLPEKHVHDGSLNPHPCDYMLTTEKAWENYKLSLDFKISPKCNSGIFVRTFPLLPRPGKDVGFNGIEIAIDDTKAAGWHDTGAIYDLVKPSKNAMTPAGEWNHIVVTSDRNLLVVEINGETVSRMNFDEWSEPNKRPDGSAHKFDVAYKTHPRKGHIGLQDHGSDCWYKNIKLLPLK